MADWLYPIVAMERKPPGQFPQQPLTGTKYLVSPLSTLNMRSGVVVQGWGCVIIGHVA